ncbi:hypothetical protein ASG25_19040 [Rhizobium sp. Leaf384]|uniref:COG4223 family protein n=1 Tax=unclassified Rhizobium TaxID=2613769 RepID=UPI00071585A9|nr:MULTISPECIES: COG4223 family protein [unclassified Rhizobium]KQS76288.1 hypothetical protein ASG25_19040 [Rhizobium sp. Leaf384]KQS78443.1 hypothetical protein ASG58_08790 [Rhizobium sp. Leaf383]
MDPEKPPRRTKPDRQPLTIDLPATPAASDAARPEDRDARRKAPETVLPADAVVAASDMGPPAKDKIDGLPTDQGTPADPAVERSLKAEAAKDARVEAAAAASAAKPAASARSEKTSSVPPTPPIGGSGPAGSSTSANRAAPARPSRSGALAAGIVGGLIALAGAGVLQYAGVLPSIGPASSNNGSSERDLAAEIDALKAQAPAAGSPASEGLEQRLAALEQAIGVDGRSSDTNDLKAQVESLTQELATVKSGLADQSRAAQATTSELSTRIEEAEKKLDEPASDVQLARAIAVTALKTAIDRGGPFLAELDALKTVSPDDPAVAGLADIAPRGVSARADLTRSFPDTADAMLAAIQGADPNQGIFSRLIGSAASAVRVRPVGSVEGTGPEAVVARIEERLTNGDLKGASLEWDGLPQPAKDAGAAFRTKLDERIKVEGLIDAAVAGAATGPTPVKQG